MHVYMNYCGYAFVLPQNVLQAMKCPKFVYFLPNKRENRVLCIPFQSRRDDLPGCSIPDSVYKHNGAYAVSTKSIFREFTYYLADVNGESTYSVQATKINVKEISAGEIPGINKAIRLRNGALVFEMMTAEKAEMNESLVFTFGGNAVP